MIWWDASWWDASHDLVVDGFSPALSEFIGRSCVPPTTPVKVYVCPRVASRALVLWTMDLQPREQGTIVHVSGSSTSDGPDIFTQTALTLAARGSGIEYVRVEGAGSTTTTSFRWPLLSPAPRADEGSRVVAAPSESRRSPSPGARDEGSILPKVDEFSLVFARSEPSAIESLRERGLDLSTMATHLQRIRPWTTASDAKPIWLASKRAVLVSDLSPPTASDGASSRGSLIVVRADVGTRTCGP